MPVLALVAFGAIIIFALPVTNVAVVYSQNSSSVLEQAQKSLQEKENKIEAKFDAHYFQANNLSLIKNANGAMK